MGTLRDQMRQILRRLAKSPMFAAITLFTLAIGIGANTAIFTVVDSVLLKPLPYLRPDELVGVWHHASGIGLNDLNMAPSNYFIYREEGRAFDDVGMYRDDSVSVVGVGEPEEVRALDVTDGILPILGVQAYLGRSFSRADDSPGSPETVMLSYELWKRKLGGDPAAVGRTLRVDGTVRQII